MIAAGEIIQEVASLVGMVPGIEVRGHELSPSEARIKFASNDKDAVDALQRAALAANVSVDPWLGHLACGAASEQTLSAGFQSRDGLEFGELQIFGIHLVWHLNKIGVLPSLETNTYLSKWGAESIVA